MTVLRRMDMATKIFISYSRTDYLDDKNEPLEESSVAKIVKTLKDNGIDVWIDVNAHYKGQYFAKVIANKILWADKVLFISSENSNSSEWVKKEILFAVERKKEIIPLKLDESEYCDDIALALAGLDYIEYFKNPRHALDKIVSQLEDIPESPDINTKKKIIVFFKGLLAVIFVFAIIFMICFSIGFSVGYFSHKTNAEKLISTAFRNCEFVSMNSHTIHYSGKSIAFVYDVNTDKLEFINDKEIRFFDNITFESVVMAMSMPMAFKNLMKTIKYAGNGKAKAGLLIVGSVGILCGYSIGNPIGAKLAQWEGEKALGKYFKQEATREKIRLMLNDLYQ